METPRDNILLLKDRVDDLEIPDFAAPINDIKQASDAKVWAFMGVSGGVGVTSLAIQTAYDLAKRNHTVCLIDLDFERGACAGYLDTAPSLIIDDLNAGEERMDEALAATFIHNYKKHFSVIAPSGELGGNDLIRPDAVLALLDTVCQMYDFVVLDIPPLWRPWTQAAIGAADKFALVTEMRVPALHRTRKLSEIINEDLSLAAPFDILVNKFERRNQLNSISLKEAQNVLNRTDLGMVCVDEDAVRSAINCGQPAGHINAESRYVKSVEAHVQSWLGEKIVPSKRPARIFPLRGKRERRHA